MTLEIIDAIRDSQNILQIFIDENDFVNLKIIA